MTTHTWPEDVRTFAIDVGGSGLKGAVLNAAGEMITERVRVDTPYPCPPEVLVESLHALSQGLPDFHRVSVGFPGLVRNGRVSFIISLSRSSLEGETDPALVEKWKDFPLQDALAEKFQLPVRVANDADVQGSAVISGQGMEFVMTLGTGCGTALFYDGQLIPHLELGHAPFRKGDSFEDQIGNAARKEVGTKRWISRVHKAIAAYDSFLFFDRIYIGGGNARHLAEEVFDNHVTLVENTAGILGGITIWPKQ